MNKGDRGEKVERNVREGKKEREEGKVRKGRE